MREGDRITADYDPMIAKLITHGPDRETALRRLSHALASTEIVGVQTNLALLQAIATHPDFAQGACDTGFIARHPDLLVPSAPTPHTIAAAALAVLAARATATTTTPADPHSPWAATNSWRLNLPGQQTIQLRQGTDTLAIHARPCGDAWQLDWQNASHTATAHNNTVTLDGILRHVTAIPGPDSVTTIANGTNHLFDIVDPLSPPRAEAAGGGRITAPIPGRIASVLVKPGDTVARGQPLLVLEAMKMEMTLTAPQDGIVATLRCAVGDLVTEGVDLAILQQDAAN